MKTPRVAETPAQPPNPDNIPAEVPPELKFGNTVYRVTALPGRMETARPAYELRGPRGARYHLLRNAHHPHQLFAIYADRFGVAGVFSNCWFIESAAGLRVV